MYICSESQVTPQRMQNQKVLFEARTVPFPLFVQADTDYSSWQQGCQTAATELNRNQLWNKQESVWAGAPFSLLCAPEGIANGMHMQDKTVVHCVPLTTKQHKLDLKT